MLQRVRVLRPQILTALFSVLFFTTIVRAQVNMTEIFDDNDNFISLKSDSANYQQSDEIIRLDGNVTIEFDGFLLSTDSMIVDRDKNLISTEGSFVLNRDGHRFEGEALELDYENDIGRMKKAHACIKGMNFFSEDVEVSPEYIVMHDMVATTCSSDSPDYSIKAKQLELRENGKGYFKKISFYYRKKKILSWPSYSMSLKENSGVVSESGVQVGNWMFSSPSLGYADHGGLRLGSGIVRTFDSGASTGLFLDYFIKDGFFPEARFEKRVYDYDVALRLGKHYKENTGYFRYFDPVIVWNEPTLSVGFDEREFKNTKIRYHGSMEVGQVKEMQLRYPEERAFLNLNAAYPINSGKKVVYSLITDGRFGLYNNWRKYRVWGKGVGAEYEEDRKSLSVQYLNFRKEGQTPLLSDLVNTNDKVFVYATHKISNRTILISDNQYDLDENRFDEVVVGATREYECLAFSFQWRTQRKQVGISMRILNPGKDK